MARPLRHVPWISWRDGVAYACWYDEVERRTKRLSLRTRDGGEAKARFAAFLKEGDAITRPQAGALTVTQALDHYIKEHLRKGGCADPRRQEDAIVHLKAFFKDDALESVGIERSEKYAEARRTGVVGVEARRSGKSRCAGDSTIRRELTVLIAAWNHERKRRRIDLAPAIQLPADTRRTADDEAPYYTHDELAVLFDMAEGELRDFVELAYYTGARRASIEDLTRPQVKWDQKRIILQTPGKVATKKRQPIVPILPPMERALTALWERSEGRSRLFETGDFYRPFRQLCEACGMAGRSNPHMLRHTRATHLLQEGVSIYAVARLLGDTVATVERVYGHHSHEYLAKELEKAA